MKWTSRIFITLLIFVAIVCCFAACANTNDCQHDWKSATCTKPKTCKLCQATEGSPIGHNWVEANCTTPKMCSVCTLLEGSALGHDYNADNTCTRCGFTPPTQEYPFTFKLSTDRSSYVLYSRGTHSDPHLVIPSTYKNLPVMGVQENAFKGCTYLTEVTISDSVIALGPSAFENCTNLTTINFESNETLTSFGSKCFAGCTAITEINLPDSLLAIGSEAFANCSNLKEISFNEGLIQIGSGAFRNCVLFKNAELPDSLTTLGLGAFGGCYNMTEITLPFIGPSVSYDTFNYNRYDYHIGYLFGKQNYEESAKVTVSYRVEEGQSNETNYYLPLKLNKVTLKGGELATSYFSGCANIYQIVLGKNVKAYFNNTYSVFAGCYKLTEIYNFSEYEFKLKDINSQFDLNVLNLFTSETETNNFKTIDDYFVYDDKNLSECYLLSYYGTDTTLVLPEKFNGKPYHITTYAFYPNNVQSVKLNSGILSIGNYAFNENLQNIYLDSLDTWLYGNFERHAFGSLNIEDENFTKKNFYINDVLLTNLVIPKEITEITDMMFSAISSIETITVEQGSLLKTISSNAFAKSFSLKSISFDNCINLTTLGQQAFYDCSNLTTISFKNCTNLTTIRSASFYKCQNLSTLFFENCYNLTTIEEHAFYGCSNLTTISFKNCINLKSIGSHAFDGCSKLETISFEDCTNLTTIETYAFMNCTNLTIVKFSDPFNVTKWGTGVFENCTSLTYNEYKGAQYIGNDTNPYIILCNVVDKTLTHLEVAEGTRLITLSNISDAITSVSVPKTIKVFTAVNRNWNKGLWANLKDLYIADLESWCSISFNDYYTNPMYYATNVYVNNQKITKLSIPNGITTIEQYTFSGMPETITELVIPSSVTKINTGAFSRARSVNLAIYIEDIVSWANIEFINREANPMQYATELYVNNQKVTSIQIPTEITKIRDYTFAYLPDSVTEIHVPSTITRISLSAFPETNYVLYIQDLTSWCNIIFENNTTYSSDDWDDDSWGGGWGGGWGDGGWGESSYSHPFKNATELYVFNQKVNSIHIPSEITTILDYTFAYLPHFVTEIHVPATVTRIAQNAFPETNYVLYIEDLVAWCNIDFEFDTTSNGWGGSSHSHPMRNATELYVNNQKVTSLVIPDGISVIKPYTFYNVISLVNEIHIPKSITKISKNAFSYVYSFGNQNSGSLNSLYIYDLIAWMNIEFENDTSTPVGSSTQIYLVDADTNTPTLLTEIVIPKEIIEIKPYTFYNWKQLTSVSFEQDSQLAQIGAYAFYGNTFSTITIPKSVTYIGTQAFSSNINLISVVFENTENWILELYYGNNYIDVSEIDVSNPEENVKLFSSRFSYTLKRLLEE